MALTAYQKHVQSILKKGGTMKQAAASWSKSSSKPKRRFSVPKLHRSAAKTGGRPTTGKNKGKRHSGGFNTSKLFKLARMASFAAPAVIRAIQPGVSATVKGYQILMDYTGFDGQTGKWNLANAGRGWLPFIATSAITYGVPKVMQIIRRL